MSSVISIATSTSAKLILRLEESAWLGSFDRVQVWRSRLTDQGPYEEITGSVWTQALHVAGGISAAPQMAPLSGRTLNLKVGLQKIEVNVTFSGVDPISAASIATQIQNAGVGLLLCTDNGGLVEIRTAQPGTAAVLEVAGGDAASVLGLSIEEPTSIAFGLDPRLQLVPGQDVYTITDFNGSEEFFYKTRFYNSTMGAVSEYSLPFSAKQKVNVDPVSLVTGTLDLVDGTGRPMANRTILLYWPNQYLQVSGQTVLGGEVSLTTDDKGHIEYTFVRGAKFRFAVAGTQMVREVTAPTASNITTFDLFNPAYGSDDVWKVQQPNVDFAVRRSP